MTGEVERARLLKKIAQKKVEFQKIKAQLENAQAQLENFEFLPERRIRGGKKQEFVEAENLDFLPKAPAQKPISEPKPKETPKSFMDDL